MSLFTYLNEEGSYSLTVAGYFALVLIILVILTVGSGFLNRGRRISVKQLSFSAMAIALAMVTSMIKLFQMPMGGIVTLCSMLFIVLIGNWYGLFAGIMGGIAFGLLNMIFDPYMISLPQVLVDYVLAFGSLGLSGFFKDKKHGLVCGYATGVFFRYAFAVLSGVIFFGAYTPAEYASPLVYSLIYNGTYIGAEAMLTIIIILIPAVDHALKRVREMAVGS